MSFITLHTAHHKAAVVIPTDAADCAAQSMEQLFEQLSSGPAGLTEAEAAERQLSSKQYTSGLSRWGREAKLLLSQFSNPLVLLLVVAVALSLVMGEYLNSMIMLLVLLSTGILSYVQEHNAGRAIEKLQQLVTTRCTARRSGQEQLLLPEAVVPGDVVVLKAGDIIPADGRIIAGNDLHVNESMLTGESFPAEKEAGNVVLRGTSVVTGSADVLVIRTGLNTKMGQLVGALEKPAGSNAFEKGIRQFGYLVMRIAVMIALAVLVLNILYERPVADSLLFALALAVGLTPELLPAIITITLSAGARRLAARKVIVRKLSAIQCLGEMTVLCSDKTGTLTQGVMSVDSAVDISGANNPQVLHYAFLNAFFESGFPNPIDEAIRKCGLTAAGYTKKDEVPYDFIRKRLSVVVTKDGQSLMITKGAVSNVLACCRKAALPDGLVVDLATIEAKVQPLFARLSDRGLRTIAVCYKDVPSDPVISRADEQDMIFLGLVCFADPLKEGIADSIHALQEKGICIKVITGDHHLIARQVAHRIGFNDGEIICGPELSRMTPEALQQKVKEVDVFAEIEPLQKEAIIRALQKNGETVGFLGDGINDAGALKAADAGISIENAVDVARDAASLVLLEKNLDVIREGVLEGRKTFGNTLKYIFVTASANFGNMFSMAFASLFLPFLPLLPVQILLNNFLSDFPALAIASDQVDAEWLNKPRKWDIRFIRRFMISFGLLSSLFDFFTFGLLLHFYHAGADEFRTGWFVESLLSEVMILLVIRTMRPFFASHPSRYLLIACVAVFMVALLLPYLPFASLIGLMPLPLPVLGSVVGITTAYVIASELMKREVMRLAA
jgi:Mg2+-importing ATPase